MSVRVFSSIDNYKNRLFMADNLRFSHSLESEFYHDQALIPVYPLQDYKETFENASDFDILDSVYSFKVDDNQFKGVIENLGIPNLESKEELFKMISERGNAYNLLKTKFSKLISQFSVEQNHNIHDIYVGSPKQLTTTIEFDKEPHKKCGLHFDNWGQLPVSELEKSQNRICINLGRGHRYFIFINKTIFKMKEELSQIDEKFNSIEDSNLLGQLYYKYIDPLNYKILFFKLEPFEGYIAPTEVVMHDGSNFDSDFVDIQLTARGLFAPKMMLSV